MAWRRRSIRMPGRFDPARWEITAGMGVREIVLVSAAAGQAIWLVLMTPALPFVVRLVVAVLIALVLFGVALVPIKDKPIEYHLFKFIGYRLRAMGRVYRTARREDLPVGQVVEVGEVAEPAVPKAAPIPSMKPQRVTLAGNMVWVPPNPAFLLAVFAGLLLVGTIITYFQHQ